MGAVDQLRRQAEKLADQLRDAEAKHTAEQAAIRDRNDERRADFWSDASDRCATARRAVTEARAAVIDKAAEGDTTGALAAYGEYVARAAEAAVVIGQAQNATRTYVWTEARQVDPNDKPRRHKNGYHTPAMERHEVRVLASVWQRTNDTAPPAQYVTEYPPNVNGQPQAVEPFDKLLTLGLERFTDERRRTFAAEYLAPLTASLEPESD